MQNDHYISNKFLYLFLISLGIFTIFYQLNFEDFWLDEMSSFWIADPSLTYSETIDRQNKTDWHNPILFNLILKFFFKLVGYNPDLARYLTFFFGSLSFFIIGLISLQEKKNNYYLLTTFLVCVSIYIIKYSQELRPYSLLLLTSSLNIYFYLKLLKSDEKKLKNIFLFIIFSVTNYSVNPFSLIIFFSQITYSLYRHFLFYDEIKKISIIYTIILIIYLFFNHRYILYQISFDNYMLSFDIKNVLDGFYFSRFFGSKLMGYFYLFLLFFLIFKNRKKFLLKNNNYLFFLIIILYSYLVPLSYGIIQTPVFHDRYIIFILIPIFVLIPFLLSEIMNTKLRIGLMTLLVLMTLSNHYIEIFKRVNTKPEFKKTLNHLKDSDTNIVILDVGSTSFLVSNYIKNIDLNGMSKFIFFNNDDSLNQTKNFWLICYSTTPNSTCEPKNIYNHQVINSMKNLYVRTKLYVAN